MTSLKRPCMVYVMSAFHLGLMRLYKLGSSCGTKVWNNTLISGAFGTFGFLQCAWIHKGYKTSMFPVSKGSVKPCRDNVLYQVKFLVLFSLSEKTLMSILFTWKRIVQLIHRNSFTSTFSNLLITCDTFCCHFWNYVIESAILSRWWTNDIKQKYKEFHTKNKLFRIKI